jgi:hypothetical protein
VTATKTMTPPPSRPEDLLDTETAAAWGEYLETVRSLAEPHFRYEEVEPWAWNRLLERLKAVEARRKKLSAKPRGAGR